MKKRVEIRVGRLVLQGIQAGQRRFVKQAVEGELTRLGAQGEITPGGQLRIPAVHLPREGKP